MTPSSERKSIPSFPPRAPRRGASSRVASVSSSRHEKTWRVIAGPHDAAKEDRPLARSMIREMPIPNGMGSSYFPSSEFPFPLFEEPTRNLEDVGRGVAHKLRSGLCALKGGLQMSLQQMLPGPTREMLALAERGAHHITEIVKDLVLLTQRPAFHPRPLDINLLLGEFLNGLCRQPDWKGVVITRRFDGALPMILGDPDLLDTVFDAVARNAAEAMAARDVPPPDEKSPGVTTLPSRPRRLAVETSRENDTIVVRMTDTGTGLSPETLELAFQPYFSTKSGRRGMGLPLARWLVHVHGGSMGLRSRPDSGTTVTFRFPDPRPLDPDSPDRH